MISFGLCSRRQLRDGVVVEALVLLADAVVDGLEPLARQVRLGAVGQVAAGGEVHGEEGVAGLQQRQEHGLVGLAAGVRLDVGEAGAEELAGALDRQVLGDVDELAAAVVAPARIALGVLVGQHRALGLEHGAADDVLGGDQLDLVALAAELVGDRGGELGVAVGERLGEEAGGGRGRLSRAEPPADRVAASLSAKRRGRGTRKSPGLSSRGRRGREWRASAARGTDRWRSSGSISWPARSRSPRRRATG